MDDDDKEKIANILDSLVDAVQVLAKTTKGSIVAICVVGIAVVYLSWRIGQLQDLHPELAHPIHSIHP